MLRCLQLAFQSLLHREVDTACGLRMNGEGVRLERNLLHGAKLVVLNTWIRVLPEVRTLPDCLLFRDAA